MKFFRHLFTFAALALMTVASAVFLPAMQTATASYPAVSVLAFLIAAAIVLGLTVAAFLHRSSVLAKVRALAFQIERQDKAVA